MRKLESGASAHRWLNLPGDLLEGATTRMLRCAWLWLALLFASPAAWAHAPDTSYCRIDIKEEAVEFTFAYDLTTLLKVVAIDVNRDGRITAEELAAATPVIENFLRRNIYPELNEREAVFGTFTPPAWPTDAPDGVPQTEWGQRLFSYTFRNAVLHAPDSVAITFDFFDILSERHNVLGNFIWKGTENPVIFTRFEPDYLFDTGYEVPAWDQFLEYLELGMNHIFLGYDHIAFLVALLFVRRFTALLKIITAFTVAHTITLGIAALGWVSLPTRLVESAIALTIAYVAAENLWRRRDAENLGEHRWRITFAFGLVHGFGFAAVLRGLGLPADGLARCLFGFNLGVELSQLAIAVVCWPLLLWIGRRTWAPRFRLGVSIILMLFGLGWFIERALALKFLPI